LQERVQKILAARGVASRRKAEELIRQGRVSVNGNTCVIGDTADGEKDDIQVDGVPLALPEEKVYIMLNKPRGYVTTMSDEKGRKTVAELVSCGKRVYPVGRLDMDSEGLLLMTNDGELANKLLHPAHQVDKTYEVWVKNYGPNKLSAMGRPMDIDGYRIRPAEVSLLAQGDDWAKLSVTIHEGRNRQIRKMAEASGMLVTRLRRIQEGTLSLGELPKGNWRFLTKNEIAQLQNL
jgi:23S rRNA pseudouridine2605 synthase